MKTKTAEKQIIELLTEVLKVAKRLTKQPKAKAAAPAKLPGIFPHQSKYNPWRAYQWDSALKKTVYLGAFPSLNKAKEAQRAYRKGQPVTTGTKAAPLRLVKSA